MAIKDRAGDIESISPLPWLGQGPAESRIISSPNQVAGCEEVWGHHLGHLQASADVPGLVRAPRTSNGHARRSFQRQNCESRAETEVVVKETGWREEECSS